MYKDIKINKVPDSVNKITKEVMYIYYFTARHINGKCYDTYFSNNYKSEKMCNTKINNFKLKYNIE